MAKPNYYKLTIGGVQADIEPEGQVPTINYALEDADAFENKKSAEAFDIELPATEVNDQIHNTLRNPSVVDNTTDSSYDNFQSAVYEVNGNEILVGKYLASSASEIDGRPESYKGKIYGLNGDWVIDLKEKTLYDFLNTRKHAFTQANIMESWYFDGRSEALDYVYAPVRYLKPFGNYPEATDDDPDPQPLDDECVINDMKPALSVYWFLWRAFKSVGYRLVSQFMDTDYYRRSVLPWTWGGFDYLDDTRWEPLKFVAGQNSSFFFRDGSYTGHPDLQMVADQNIKEGTFQNTIGLYDYTSGASVLPFTNRWTYLSPLSLGNVRAAFSISLRYSFIISSAGGDNSDAELAIHWYRNGVLVHTDTIVSATSPNFGRNSGMDDVEVQFEVDIEPGDWVGASVYVHLYESITFGGAEMRVLNTRFELSYMKLGPNSTIDFSNYPKFKNYKWLDLLRGEIDLFDLSIQTDPVRKEVYIEPTHNYDINGIPYPGYFNRQQLDFSQKVDESQRRELELYSEMEREQIFKFIDDANDGGLKKVQDRTQATIGLAKYVLPERYKTTETKERENRFYSPVMHYEHQKFKPITGVAPQLIAIIPENVSNTSASESENVYNPKRAWYKGNIPGYGGWKFMGSSFGQIPMMFAVNYKAGGENDPVLSYSDQSIGGNIAKGLMNKFFLQRMAIYRHGRRYNTINLKLNNYDVSNFLHRESIIIKDVEYLLIQINNYNPVSDDSTECMMWMFVPVTTKDRDNAYPSIAGIQNGETAGTYDVKYYAHLLLTSDIPV